MKINTILSAVFAAFVLAVSCADLSPLEDRLDSLESRIKAIENIIPALNSNIEALQAIAENSTINSVEELDGEYKITLSNGSVLRLTQGSIGVANPPLMSIDADGYWMVDYQDGYGATYILCNGNKVKAVGDDGTTPRVSVDENGCWTVSYDGGKTWEQVKDAAGKPVEAIPSEGADEYFSDIVLTEDSFTIIFKDGKKVSIPIVAHFIFNLNAPMDVEVFKLGESREYLIVSKGVAAVTVVSQPEGFTTVLTKDKLFVKAVGVTKASADSRTDIALLAVSEEGYAAIGKVRVQIEGTDQPVEPEDPDHPDTPDQPAEPEDPQEPEEPVASGNLQLWNAGEDFVIGGRTFNKAMFADITPVLLTADSNAPIKGDGIYFVEADVTAVLDLAGTNADMLIVIGNDPERRAKLSASSQLRISFSAETDYAVFSNLEIDFSGAGNYPVNLTNNAAGVFEYLIFDNCFVTPYAGNGNFHYNGIAGKNISNFIFKDSEILLPAEQTTYKLIAASKGQDYSNITLDNSIFYSKAAKAVKFNIWEGYASGITSVLDKLTISQCSFINLQINNGFVRVADLNSIDIHNNIFYTTDSSVSSWQYILRAETNGPSSGIGKDNFAYIQGNDSQSYKMFYSDAQMNAIGAEQFKKSPALFDASLDAQFDVEGGVFIPSKNYKKHGAQR